jgi:penicillin-binding protein 1C
LLSSETAFWITDILSDRDARGWAFGNGGSLDFPFPVAVKTGTSQAYHDNWTIGYTSEVTVGVWVGNFDRRELKNSSGVTGAAPIFHDVMMAAHVRVGGKEEEPPNPPTLMRVPICALSGLEATPECANVEQEWLPVTRQRRVCDWHVRRDGAVAVAWPEEFRTWARTAFRNSPAPLREKSQTVVHLKIESPSNGATYLIDPTLRAAFQAVRLRANATADEHLRWSVDGREIASALEPSWPLRAGEHVIRVEDSKGHSDESRIYVK